VRALRASAVAALLLLGIYFVLRFIATQCSGAQCDAYIWPSLVFPVGVVLLVFNTGRLAISDARKAARAWFAPFVATTLLGVLGPVVAVAVFRDQPDAVVAVSTVLLLLTPLAALVYSFRRSPSPIP
jgi:hypothetical protein